MKNEVSYNLIQSVIFSHRTFTLLQPDWLVIVTSHIVCVYYLKKRRKTDIMFFYFTYIALPLRNYEKVVKGRESLE